MRALRAGAVLGALLLAVAPARAQQTEVEAWAARIVDHPAMARGDLDGAVEEWLAMVAGEPDHPLAEGTLRIAGMVADRTADPAAIAGALLALPAQGLTPLGERQLELLQGAAKATRLPVALPPEDLFPGFLSRGFVLGPLAPLDDPLAERRPSPEFGRPGFGEAHAGADGDVRWQPLSRYPLSPGFEPSQLFEPARGWGLVAFVFDVPQCGPGWIEISQRRSGSVQPPYAFSVNGGDPVVVEHLHDEASPVSRSFVTLNSGRNRVILKFPVDARPQLAVRVVDEQGRQWPGLSEVGSLERAAEPLGPPDCHQFGPRPAPPADTIAFLSSLPDRGPDAEALLGLLLSQEGRQAQGLAHVTAACQAAPDRPGLAALRARLVLDADYLPPSWKKSTARALAEEVVKAEPLRLDMALFLAGVAADEDREEDALKQLDALGQALPAQAQSRLAQADVYRRLEMDVAAENALLAAQALAPSNPAVLRALSQFYGRAGQPTRSAELSLSAARAAGSGGATLRQLAGRFAALGRLDRAEPLYREAVLREGDRDSLADLGEFLASSRRWDEADAIYAEIERRYPGWERPSLQRADVARMRGDGEAEARHLREALARTPSSRVARERLADLTGEDPVGDYFKANLLDLDEVRERFDPGASQDSIIKLVDHAVVMVYPDGGTETVTQDLYMARDLEACEALGSLRPAGEVLRIATIKPDGTEYEPVRTGSYVMPSLKPGDFVVHVTRTSARPPRDGVLRAGSWYFASTDEPFRRSSYVISVPKSVPLRLVQRQFSGEHSLTDTGDAVVHAFVQTNQPRVLLEPHAPPPKWFLPWIEFGQDADRESVLANLEARVLPPTLVTPEIRAAAERATAGLSGDVAKARALHDMVNETLDQRGWQDATAALLQREGNPAYLYSALLEAAGVPHELVWSRNVAPDADDEPDPPFLEDDYWSRNLLVLVEPADGEPAWCDMNSKTMPYGHLVGDAPGAPSVALPSGRLTALPALPPAERPGVALAIDLDLAADGSARVAADLRWTAGIGYVVKEQLREAPEAQRKNWMTGMAAWLVHGIDLSSYSLPGMDSADEPMSVHVEGEVPAFLDDDGSSLVCRLPFPTLDLKGELAGGEGLRKLPYFLDRPQVQSTVVTMRLAPGLDVAGVPADLSLELHGGSYALSIVRKDPGTLVIRRELALPPFAMPASQYAGFEAFCSKVDEAERGRLRFALAAPAAGPAAAPAAEEAAEEAAEAPSPAPAGAPPR